MISIFRKLLVSLLILIPISYFSQNLISNGSFENSCRNSDKNWSKGIKKIPVNWTTPIKDASPDYYHSFIERFLKSKKSNAEKVSAQNGKRFIGVHLNYGKVSEYIQSMLLEPLKKDELYCFKMYVRLSKNSRDAINGLGVLFTSNKIAFSSDRKLNLTPQLFNPEDNTISNRENWKLICGMYKASGNEQYITIGKFRQNIKIEKNEDVSFSNRKTSLDKNLSAYYLFDNLSITHLKGNEKCNCNLILNSAKNEVNPIKKDTSIKVSKETITDSVFVLDEIYFNINDSLLLPKSHNQLDKLAQYLLKNKKVKIRIKGYTDNTGGFEFNLLLSKARAKSVYNYLLLKEISSYRMKYMGYGSDNPIDNNDTEKGRERNRRVEIKIVKL